MVLTLSVWIYVHFTFFFLLIWTNNSREVRHNKYLQKNLRVPFPRKVTKAFQLNLLERALISIILWMNVDSIDSLFGNRSHHNRTYYILAILVSIVTYKTQKRFFFLSKSRLQGTSLFTYPNEKHWKLSKLMCFKATGKDYYVIMIESVHFSSFFFCFLVSILFDATF